MSSRKRAMRRAHRDAIRKAAGEGPVVRDSAYWKAPEGTPIRSLSHRQTVTLDEARGQVKERLRAYNPKPGDSRPPEEVLKDMDRTLTSDLNWYQNAPTHVLVQHEKVYTDIVENKVTEHGHHSEIPAFQKAKAEAAEAILTTIRGTLHERPQGRRGVPIPRVGTIDGSGSHVGGRINQENRAAAEVRGRALGKRAADDELKRTADSAVTGPKEDRREFKDRMRRIQWEARNRAKARDQAAAPETNPAWAREAAQELADGSFDVKVGDDKGLGSISSTGKVRPTDVALVKAYVAGVAKRRGISEAEVYMALAKAKGPLSSTQRKALYMASGIRPPERGEAVPVIEPRSPVNLRPVPARPKFRDPKSLPRINDDDLAAYRDRMQEAAESKILTAEQRNRARDAHRAAVAEIKRRKRGITRR
ncbi:hypothetical protein K8O93_00950 [Gordonia bronchialis]|uniref:hypothetical protein n=1 Tax=Gordonia bronchialis TaxID=2054 RepID=UPI001CC0B2FA|nr:hypothetical protein [Gordonia bronchialis]UAK38401.1 hypothetical protein K8O93_00950 [Gordonia bronchialis]